MIDVSSFDRKRVRRAQVGGSGPSLRAWGWPARLRSRLTSECAASPQNFSRCRLHDHGLLRLLHMSPEPTHQRGTCGPHHPHDHGHCHLTANTPGRVGVAAAVLPARAAKLTATPNPDDTRLPAATTMLLELDDPHGDSSQLRLRPPSTTVRSVMSDGDPAAPRPAEGAFPSDTDTDAADDTVTAVRGVLQPDRHPSGQALDAAGSHPPRTPVSEIGGVWRD
jgi:hypothetical protein